MDNSPMIPSGDITDTWFGPFLTVVAGAVTAFFNGMDGPALVLWLIAAGWGITKWRNERTRARILARVEAEKPSGYHGPFRRRTDPVNVIDTAPGALK